MAGENRDTMEDLEDGELSGSNSDSEMGANVDGRGKVIILLPNSVSQLLNDLISMSYSSW